jgi:hypothetical protein
MARIRITIDTEESHKRAFLAHASIEGLTPQELFQRMVEEYCAADLDRARKSLEGDEEEEPPRKRKS